MTNSSRELNKREEGKRVNLEILKKKSFHKRSLSLLRKRRMKRHYGKNLVLAQMKSQMKNQRNKTSQKNLKLNKHLK